MDKKEALKLVSLDGKQLETLSDNFKNDKDIVLKAVKQYGIALYYASAELRNNKDVVLTAVMENKWALHFASDSIKESINEINKENPAKALEQMILLENTQNKLDNNLNVKKIKTTL